MMNLFENLQLMKEAEENSYDPNNYIWDGKSEVPKDVVSVTIKDEVTKIGEFAFYDCESLQKVNIPNSVTEIRIAAFNECKSLQNINIPNSVTEIGDYAFEYCKSLQKVNISNTKIKIGEGAFSKCPNVKVYKNGKSNDHDNTDDNL